MPSAWAGNKNEVELHVGDVLALRSWRLVDFSKDDKIGFSKNNKIGLERGGDRVGPHLESMSYNHIWDSKTDVFRCPNPSLHRKGVIPQDPYVHNEECYYRQRKLSNEMRIEAKFFSSHIQYKDKCNCMECSYHEKHLVNYSGIISDPLWVNPSLCSCHYSRVPLRPEPHCSCGFYAKKANHRTEFNGDICGLVRLSGRILEGTKGYRAEKIEILALFKPSITSSVPHYVPTGHRFLYRKMICDQLQERYDVPFVPKYKKHYRVLEDILKY